jgi:eukaryotic-like serine/threonine-protein kinase
MVGEDRTVIASRGSQVSIGTELNETYKIDSQIGIGGMGEVFKGHNIQTGDPVAIKIVLPEFARDEMILELFRKEARILNHLNHDVIVRYYVFSIDRVIGRPYLAMEYVDGPSLAEHVKAKQLDPDDFNRLLRRLADGLHKAHAAGVIHRDMSPDNVILPGGLVSNAKIIDFGIARSANVGGGTLLGGSFAGKYSYVSPEQLGLFGGDVTPKSDIYSLALVMAAAIRGQPINMSGSQVEVIEKRRVVPPLDGIPKQYHAVMTAMLQPDPAHRPADMAAVRDWVEPEKSKPAVTKSKKPAEQAKPVTSATTPQQATPAASNGMRNAVIGIGALAVVGVGALGGWIFVQSQKPAVETPQVSEQTPEPVQPKPIAQQEEAKPVEQPTEEPKQVVETQPVETEVVKAPEPVAETPQAETKTAEPTTPTVTPEPKPAETEVADATQIPKPPIVAATGPETLSKLVSDFHGGSCFNARLTTVSADAAAISVFGAADPAEKLRGAFQSTAGFDPKVTVYPVGEDQCDFLSGVSRLASAGAVPLTVEIENATINGTNRSANKIGDPLSLRITGLEQRNLYVFLVAYNGEVLNVSRARPDVIKLSAEDAVVRMTIDNPPVLDGEQAPSFYPMMVFAVASPKPLYSINTQPVFDSLGFIEPLEQELKNATDVSDGLAFFKLAPG